MNGWQPPGKVTAMAVSAVNALDFTRPVIDPREWQGLPIPTREWLVQDLIPTRVVTMLSGDGGLGKSTLVLQLAVASAIDEPWIGRRVMQCKTLLVACEDEPDELQRRLYDIKGPMLEFDQLSDIRIVPGVGFDNVLVDFSDPADHGKRTEFCEFVEAQALEFGARHVILDSLHDFFDANENLRPQARQFINHLRRIAIAIDGAVTILSHPSVSGLTSKDGRAGSTAWSNTVRSRLYLTKPDDPEAKHLVLKTMKSNYGPNGGEIKIEYRSGCFYSLTQDVNEDPVYRQESADLVFIKCLRQMRNSGRNISDAPNSGAYAPKIFCTLPAANGYSKSEIEKAMRRLFEARKIEVRTDHDRHRNRVKGIFEGILKDPETGEME